MIRMLSLCLLLLAPPVVAGEPGVPCGGLSAEARDTRGLISQAVGILRAAGHAPEEFRLELRMEPALHPDFPEWGDARVRSVVFVPRVDGRYPVRVHPASPCELMWVWRPPLFTAWQREAIRHARELLTPALDPDGPEVVEVRVFENAEALDVRVLREIGDAPGPRESRVVLAKRELAGD